MFIHQKFNLKTFHIMLCLSIFKRFPFIFTSFPWIFNFTVLCLICLINWVCHYKQKFCVFPPINVLYTLKIYVFIYLKEDFEMNNLICKISIFNIFRSSCILFKINNWNLIIIFFLTKFGINIFSFIFVYKRLSILISLWRYADFLILFNVLLFQRLKFLSINFMRNYILFVSLKSIISHNLPIAL